MLLKRLFGLVSLVIGIDGLVAPSRRDVLSTTLSSAGAAVLLPAPAPAVPAMDSTSSTIALYPSSTSRSDSVTLPGDVNFPLASFGLQIYDDETAYKLTLLALEKGYRNFFASVLAGNQRGFARAVKDSGIERSKLFICGSVVSNRASGFDAAYAATTRGWKQNMEAFSAGNIEYLDQIMLDYPGPDCDSIRGQWKAFEEMAAQKLTKTMAVSNFSPAQLDCVLSTPSIKFKPVVNQLPLSVAYHPGGVKNTVAANSERGLIVQAWAPLGGSLGGRFSKALKSKCGEVGKKYGGKSYAQVALRWLVQNGAAFTTQSQNAAHFAEDLDIFDFELTPEDMATLDQLV